MNGDDASGRGVRRWRWYRPLLWALAAYVALVAVGNGLILGGVVLARALGKDPRVDVLALPDIAHLRQVDERVWAGRPPEGDEYPEVAAMGIELVIDLQTGEPGDARVDRSALAERLGMEYVWVPVTDGWAPDRAEVAAVLAAIEGTDGEVLIHCGAGVGRTTAMTAAYEAAAGRDPSLLRRLAVGPPSFEQVWFIVAVAPHEPFADNPIVDALNRYVIDFPRKAVSFVDLLL